MDATQHSEEYYRGYADGITDATAEAFVREDKRVELAHQRGYEKAMALLRSSRRKPFDHDAFMDKADRILHLCLGVAVIIAAVVGIIAITAILVRSFHSL